MKLSPGKFAFIQPLLAKRTLPFTQMNLLHRQPKGDIKVWLMVIVGMMLLIWIFVGYFKAQKSVNALETSLEKNRIPVFVQHKVVDRAEAEAIKQSLNQLNIPWGQLFNVLETVQSDDIHIISLLPESPKQSFVLNAEAHDLDSMLKYVSAMSHQPGLRNVHLLNQQIQEEGKETFLAFTLEGIWVKP